ncbi:MAG TPA: thiamine pyrophosphate-dependent enzyme, partial [Vicinamibacterales bacterium]|nr:thiamine pyrophosphate-dependent enzyme [Vicinamibacterales bacterium]
NSCMGYEIPGAIGAKLGDPARHVWCFIGDGTYLMMPQELLTAVQEKLKMTVVIVDNRGYGSIAALSNSLGGQEFGTRFFERSSDGRLAGPMLEVDFAANARSYGAEVFSASTARELREALAAAKEYDGLSVIYVQVDSQARFGGSGAWWDVPMAAVSDVDTTIAAREVYDAHKSRQRLYL